MGFNLGFKGLISCTLCPHLHATLSYAVSTT